MKTMIRDSLIPAIMKFVNTKAIIALRNGIIYTMPLTIVGSVFLIISCFPYQPVVDWLDSVQLLGPMTNVTGATFDILAIAAVVGIAYEYVKAEGYPALNAGIISFVCFLILQKSTVLFTPNSEVINALGSKAELLEGAEVGGIINKAWTGGKGMIAAILIGLLVGWIYSLFMKHDIRIKMPAGVPEGVANSFTSLIPAFVMVTGAFLIYAVFQIFGNTTLLDAIYRTIQTPLQGMTDSLAGVMLMGLMIPFLWLFGVHGSTIIGGIMGTPILTPNSLANQAILDSGRELTIANGGHIVTQQFLDQFMTVTGAGMTIGLVVYLVFFAKSAKNKEIGKLSGIPALFNINEPVIFGIPIVLNPMLAIPFIAMPVISGLILYTAQYVGLVPLFGGVLVPWTTPPIISGFLVGGWQAALCQAVVLIISFFVYLPFIRRVDKKDYEMEQLAQADE